MFKKLILLVLIALLAIPALTACSSKATGEITPPAVAATEQEPSNPTNTPAATPTPATTPPEKVSEKDPEKAIPVPEFIEQAESGRYKMGDKVLVSGTVEKAWLYPDETLLVKSSPANILFLGPKTNRLYVRVDLKEETKLKIGDKIIVKAIFNAVTANYVSTLDAVVQ